MLNPEAQDLPSGGGVDPAPKPTRRSFTAEYRASVLAEYEAAPHGEKSAVLRREGIFQTQVAEWAKAREGTHRPSTKMNVGPQVDPLTAHMNVRAVSELGLDFGSDPVADQARLRAVSGMEQTRLEPRRHARIDLHVRPLSDPALHRCCEATHVRRDDLAALRFRQGYRVLLDNAQDLPPAMKVSP